MITATRKIFAADSSRDADIAAIKLLPEGQQRLLACSFARYSLPNWDGRYPDDHRPHEAIRAGELFVVGKIDDAARDAARAAAWSAGRDAARDAAWSAAWAAGRAAAWDAAWDAARAAAGAAGEAARAAAWDAAWDVCHQIYLRALPQQHWWRPSSTAIALAMAAITTDDPDTLNILEDKLEEEYPGEIQRPLLYSDWVFWRCIEEEVTSERR